MIKNILKNQRGIGLVGIIIATGMLATLSIVMMKMTAGVQKSNVFLEAKLEELEVKKNIAMILANKEACQKTFMGINLGSPVSWIKNSADVPVFEIGKVYGNNNLKIATIKTQDHNQVGTDGSRVVDLVVGLQRNKALSSKNIIEVKIQLKVMADSPTGAISACFSESGNILEQSCDSLDGTWLGSTCSLNLYVLKTGDTMTGALNVPILNSSGNITANQICTGTTCKTIPELALANQTCPAGTLQAGVKIDGSPNCKDVTCASDKYFAGLDTSGNKICNKAPVGPCGPDQYVSSISNNGDVICKALVNSTANCSTGNYIQDISEEGNATCQAAPIVAGKTCAVGSYAQGFTSAGEIICHTDVVPVNCIGAWGECSKTCDPGIQTYTITTNASDGGMACPTNNGATQTCNLGSCLYSYYQPATGCASGGYDGGTLSLPHSLCTNPNSANSYHDNPYGSIYKYWEFNCSGGRIQTITFFECGED